MSAPLFFGGSSQPGVFRALTGTFRFLQGAANSKRRLPPVGPVLLLGVLLLLVRSGDGSSDSLVWDLSKRAVEAVPLILVVGGCAWAISASQRVRPDVQGMVPIPKKDSDRAALALVTQAQKAQEVAVAPGEYPSTLTHLQIMERRPEPLAPPPTNGHGPVRIPPLAKVLEVEADNPKIYVPGITPVGGLVQIDYEKAGPFTVCGVQGTFKTELLVQAVLHFLWRGGRRVALFDPDAGHPQSLTNRLGPLADERILGYPMGYDEASCRRVMQMLYAEAYEACDQNLPMLPLFAAMDEANFVATLTHKDTKEAFCNLTSLMSLKLRKRIVTMGMAIQNPTEKKTGNDGILQTFGWAMSGRVEPRVRGRALRQANEQVPEDIGMLPLDGTFYVFNPMVGAIEKMHIPMSTRVDLLAVHERCLAREEVTGIRTLNGYTPEALVTTAPQAVLTAERLALVEDVDRVPSDPPGVPCEKLRALHSEGKGNREIIRECWGEKVKGGNKYGECLRMLAMATKNCGCEAELHDYYDLPESWAEFRPAAIPAKRKERG